MKTSPFLDEIRAESREEGREQGQLALLLRQGRHKFGAAPSKKQQKALKAIADAGGLETLAERLLDVDSWTQLLSNGQ